MVEAGHAKRRKGGQLTGGDDLFLLTMTGARAALKPGERLDPEDFPHANRPLHLALPAGGFTLPSRDG